MPGVSHGTAKSARARPVCLSVCLSSGHVTHIWDPKRPFAKRSLHFLLQNWKAMKSRSIKWDITFGTLYCTCFGKPNILDLRRFVYFLVMPVYNRYASGITTMSLDLQVYVLCVWNSCAKKADIHTTIEVSFFSFFSRYLIHKFSLQCCLELYSAHVCSRGVVGGGYFRSSNESLDCRTAGTHLK